MPVPDGAVVTAEFADGRIAGTSGCNRYSASYDLTETGAFRLTSPAVSTMMACAPELMTLERAVHAALTAAVRATFTDDGTSFSLVDADGEVVATWAAPDADELVGRWLVTSLHRPEREAIVSVAEGTAPTAEFTRDADGWRVHGDAGCNSYRASCTVEGERISVGAAMTTRKMCPGDDVMEQEQALLAALARAVRLRIEGDRLTLLRDDGGIAVDLRRG